MMIERLSFNRPAGYMLRNQRGQFIKGCAPWNKGKSTGTGGSLKKGHIPHNLKPEGTMINRGGNLVKKIDGKWVNYSWWVWESVNGKIPQGHVITFRDRNRTNCDISNLECISRKELSRRNYNGAKQRATKKRNARIKELRIRYGLSA